MTPVRNDPAFDIGAVVKRNTILLGAAQAASSGMLQLQAAVASLTLVTVVKFDNLLGLGPAIALTAGALTALPAGRLMDRVGRIPVLAGGAVLGLLGCALAAAGSRYSLAPLVVLALVGVGASAGVSLLTRAAAADMYPPQRRARGISLVLVGSVFGAVLGPFVFSPLVRGRALDAEALAILWLAAAGFTLVSLILLLLVRPDPRTIAGWIQPDPTPTNDRVATPLPVLLSRPGVVPSIVAAQASFGVMVGLMTLTGPMVVDHHNHAGSVVFPIIGAHLFGMYALVLVVGSLIDRIGRLRALASGLFLMAVSALSLVWIKSVPAIAASLFVLGLGWNLSFVAATAELADRSGAAERGRMLGFNDLLSGMTGAVLAISGGAVLQTLGVTALAVGATFLVIGPGIWILTRNRVAEAI
ncbi:MAG: MFS transporter [Actinomycetota bacterium]